MKKRIISAICMIIVFVPFLILGGYYYIALGCVLGMIGLWEMMRLEKNIPSYMKYISFIACFLLILYKYDNLAYYDIINFPVLASMFLIYSFSIIINKNLKKYNYKDCLWLFGITLMIGMMFNSFIKVRLIGLYQVIYCLLIATVTDTFALIGGKKFGKHKLSPEISPHKTIEGSIFGSLFGTIIATIFYYYAIGNLNIWLLILLSFILTLFGQMGDLFFSSIKRYYSVKDFSDIIPGHGGLLDRLDSLLFVIIGYLVYILVI